MNLFTISGLTKEYGEGGAKVVALNNVNLTIQKDRRQIGTMKALGATNIFILKFQR